MDLNDIKTTDFDYDLPEELIAQTPLKDRKTSRMMVLHIPTGMNISISMILLTISMQEMSLSETTHV